MLLPLRVIASGVLMNAHNGRVDHLDGCIMGSSQCVHDAAPYANLTPANEPIIASSIGAKHCCRSRHGAPDRKTQKMPFRTWRSFTRGTPRGLFGGQICSRTMLPLLTTSRDWSENRAPHSGSPAFGNPSAKVATAAAFAAAPICLAGPAPVATALVPAGIPQGPDQPRSPVAKRPELRHRRRATP